jgi:hypothetical protein
LRKEIASLQRSINMDNTTTNNTSRVWITLIALVILVAGIYFFFFRGTPESADETANTPGNTVICTMDARQCPDGSYVGRTGPNCEFVCPDSSSTANPNGNGSDLYPADMGK